MAFHIYFLYFSFLFPMWISKTLQPIYWEAQGKLDLFSISYVTMAVAGACSFAYAKCISYVGLKMSLLLGFILYGGGLILRGYPLGIFMALISGLVAGIGASTLGLALKSLILTADKESQKRLLLHTDNLGTMAQSLGALIAGGLITVISIFSNDAYYLGLLVSGTIVLIPIFMIFKLKINNNEKRSISEKRKIQRRLQSAFSQTDGLLMGAFIISGTCWALILPIIPIYLKKLEFSDPNIGLVMSIGVISGLFLKNIYMVLFSDDHKSISLLVFSCLCVLVIYGALWALRVEFAMVFAISIISMYMFRAVCSLLINFIEMEIASYGDPARIFGLIQSAFLTGDILGGIALPYVYKAELLVNYPLLFICAILLSNILVVSASHKSSIHSQKQ